MNPATTTEMAEMIDAIQSAEWAQLERPTARRAQLIRSMNAALDRMCGV